MAMYFFYFFIGALVGTVLLGRTDVPYMTWLGIWAGAAIVCVFVRFLVLTERDKWL
jgi:hypothetical protein